jgi:hypothetical protein
LNGCFVATITQANRINLFVRATVALLYPRRSLIRLTHRLVGTFYVNQRYS